MDSSYVTRLDFSIAVDTEGDSHKIVVLSMSPPHDLSSSNNTTPLSRPYATNVTSLSGGESQ